jgi:hypothetical protein
LVKNRSYNIYMDKWFSSPKVFDHLWACGTKTADIIRPSRKDARAFSMKQKGWKIILHKHDPMAINWRDLWDVYFLGTARDDEVSEVQPSKCEHKKISWLQQLTTTSMKLMLTNQTTCWHTIHST